MKRVLCLLVLTGARSGAKERDGRGLWDNLGASYAPPHKEKASSLTKTPANNFWSQISLKEKARQTSSDRDNAQNRALEDSVSEAGPTRGDAEKVRRFLNKIRETRRGEPQSAAKQFQEAGIQMRSSGGNSWKQNRKSGNGVKFGGGGKFGGGMKLGGGVKFGGGAEQVAESRVDEVMRVHRLAAATLGSLQGRPSKGQGSGRRGSSGKQRLQNRFGTPRHSNRNNQVATRRMGMNRRQDEVSDYDEETEISADSHSRGNSQTDSTGTAGDKRLAAQVNAVTVLDMIKNLQEEIKDIDVEISKENEKMIRLKKTKEIEEEEDTEFFSSNAAQESAEETMKELALQKEDTTMKKIIAQMMLMKQIQNKKTESDKLEVALGKLVGRRKVINSALRKQKEVAEEKRRLAKIEIERQKEIMTEKQRIIQSLLQRQEDDRKRKQEADFEEKTKISLRVKEKLRKQADIEDKTELLEAHLKLVDRSNDRILARIQQLKLQREKEAVDEQEKVLIEQQAAINALRELEKDRKRKQQRKKKKRPPLKIDLTTPESSASPSFSPSSTLGKIKIKESALLNLSPGERKQVMEWLDLERNAEILQKTDLKIAEKLRLKSAADPSGGVLSSALNIKNAAQILLENDEDDITDSEIEDILGLSGIDSGLSVDDILGLDDPSILDDDYQLEDDYPLDEVDLEFEDYEYYDDDDYYEYEEDDYYEVLYDDLPIKEDEYDYDYQPRNIPALPKPKPKPRPRPQPRPTYSKPRYPSKQYQSRPSRPYSPSSYKPSNPYRPARPYNPPSYSTQTQYNTQYRPKHSGAQFLEDVSGILETAEHSIAQGVQPHITLTGSLRSALLRDVNDHVSTEVQRLPGGRVSTKVRIGGRPQLRQPSNPATSRIPAASNFRLVQSNQMDPRTPRRPSSTLARPSPTLQRPTVNPPASFSDILVNNQRARSNSSPSFGELVGDLLDGQSLPPGF